MTYGSIPGRQMSSLHEILDFGSLKSVFDPGSRALARTMIWRQGRKDFYQ